MPFGQAAFNSAAAMRASVSLSHRETVSSLPGLITAHLAGVKVDIRAVVVWGLMDLRLDVKAVP